MSVPHFSRTLKRNCSMSPARLAAVFAALAVLVLGIGAGFAVAGAWLVLPFAGLEVLLLAAAYVLYARHAADYERIELDAGRLKVEVGDAERVARYEMDGARVALKEGRLVLHGRLAVRGTQQELEIGRHLDVEGRARLAAELEKNLIRGRLA